MRRKPRVRLSFEALAIEGYTNANKAERTISGKPNPHYMGENGAWGRYRSGWVALGSALQKLPSVGELGVVVTTYRASRKTSSRNEVEKIAKAAGRDGRLARHEDDELLALESRVSRLAPGEQGSRLGELASELLGERTGEAVDTHATFHKLRVRISKIDLSDTDVRAVSVFGPTQKPHVFCNRLTRWGQSIEVERFTLAHELCHLLLDREWGGALAVASGPWAPLASLPGSE